MNKATRALILKILAQQGIRYITDKATNGSTAGVLGAVTRQALEDNGIHDAEIELFAAWQEEEVVLIPQLLQERLEAETNVK